MVSKLAALCFIYIITENTKIEFNKTLIYHFVKAETLNYHFVIRKLKTSKEKKLTGQPTVVT